MEKEEAILKLKLPDTEFYVDEYLIFADNVKEDVIGTVMIDSRNGCEEEFKEFIGTTHSDWWNDQGYLRHRFLKNIDTFEIFL